MARPREGGSAGPYPGVLRSRRDAPSVAAGWARCGPAGARGGAMAAGPRRPTGICCLIAPPPARRLPAPLTIVSAMALPAGEPGLADPTRQPGCAPARCAPPRPTRPAPDRRLPGPARHPHRHPPGPAPQHPRSAAPRFLGRPVPPPPPSPALPRCHPHSCPPKLPRCHRHNRPLRHRCTRSFVPHTIRSAGVPLRGPVPGMGTPTVFPPRGSTPARRLPCSRYRPHQRGGGGGFCRALFKRRLRPLT